MPRIMIVYELAVNGLSIYSLPLLVTAAATLLMGFFVLAGERTSSLRACFFLLTVAITIWLCGFAMLYSAATPEAALGWARIAYLGIPFIAPALYQFVVTMFGLGRQFRVLVAGAWLAGLVFAIAAASSNLLLAGVRLMPWGYYPSYGSLGALFVGLTLGLGISAVLHVAGELRSADTPVQRQRLRWLALSALTGLTAAVDFIPTYGIPLYPFGYVGILGFLGVSGWALWHDHLFDITPQLAAPLIVENMADGMVVLDGEGVIRLINPATAHMLGYPADELLGRSPQAVLQDAAFAAQWGRLLLDEAATGHELVYQGVDDANSTFSVKLSRISGSGNRTLAIICLLRDITEQKNTTTALEKNAALVEMLQVVAVAANEATSVAGAMQTCLDAVCKLTGWPIGHYCTLASDDSGELVNSELWHIDEPMRFKTFTRVLASMRYAPRAGLPGMVLVTGKPAWVTNLMHFDKILRARIPRNVNMRATFAFPVLVGAEVVGVMEFFSPEALEPDPALLEVMGHIGVQIGRVVERRRTDEEIRQLNEDLEQRIAARTFELEVANRVLKSEVSERKRAESALQELATTDEVTGLLNRRELNRLLRDEIYRANRYQRPMVLIMGDLDYFKQVNDSYGHPVGDAVLRWVAQLMRSNLRSTDRLARYGGEELALILPETTALDAQTIAEHMRVLVASQPFAFVKDGGAVIEVPITISFGVARLDGDIASDDALVAAADIALYEAKRLGRNRTVQYSPDLLPARPIRNSGEFEVNSKMPIPLVPNQSTEPQ